MDYQLCAFQSGKAATACIGGGTVMRAPSRLNNDDRYYEARLNQKTPQSRGTTYITARLAAQRKSVCDRSLWITGSYPLHVSRRHYLTIGLGY